MTRNRIIAIIAIVVVVFAMATLGAKRLKTKDVKTTAQIQKMQGMPVQVAKVEVGSINDTIPVTGSIQALDSVTLTSKSAGKIIAVTVREGDAVRRGQVVVQLDPSDAQSTLMQAQAGLQAAVARLSQAKTNVSVTAIQSNAAIQQAKAGLTAAQANYQKVSTGARSQERLIAENQVATAKANLDNAQTTLKRYKSLYNQGAIAASQLDTYQTQYEVALASFNTAKQNLSLVQEGSRSEDIRTAEQQVNQAKDALISAKANASQNALRREDVRSAEAGVAQARAQLAAARDALANTSIRSTVDGIVSKRMVDPGQSVPGSMTNLLEIVNVRTVYFEADVSETVLGKVRPGQTADVKVDAYPNDTFIGTIEKINPSAATNTRNFVVRVQVPNPSNKLRPGMFASGSIITGGTTGAVLVPQDAVEERNGEYIVFTIANDADGKPHAKKHMINKGLSNPQFVQLNAPSDIRVGDTVVTSGHESLDDDTLVLLGK